MVEVPNELTRLPEILNTCTLSLLVSATSMCESFIVTPRGLLNAPSALSKLLNERKKSAIGTKIFKVMVCVSDAGFVFAVFICCHACGD